MPRALVASRWRLALGAWLILVVVSAGLLGSVNLWSYLRLIHGAEKVTGRITSRQPLNYDSIAAEFEVGGHSVAVFRTFVVPPNPPKADLHVGDPVFVYYLPSAPQVATLGDPRQLLPGELLSVVLTAMALPTLAVGTALWMLRRRR